jgi:hypothetical protein
MAESIVAMSALIITKAGPVATMQDALATANLAVDP